MSMSFDDVYDNDYDDCEYYDYDSDVYDDDIEVEVTTREMTLIMMKELHRFCLVS